MLAVLPAHSLIPSLLNQYLLCVRFRVGITLPKKPKSHLLGAGSLERRLTLSKEAAEKGKENAGWREAAVVMT
jgi:hypothetical protein